MLTTKTGLLDLLRGPNPSPEAWRQFDELYRGVLLAQARRQGFQDADAEDVVQTIVGNIHQLLGKYERRHGQRFLNWLLRVTRNECGKRRRQRDREAAGPDGLSGVAETPEVPAIEAAEEAEDLRRLVVRAMELVRDDFTDRVWMAFVGLMIDRRPAAEVAAKLGMTIGAVRLARHRVLARLREILDGSLD